MSANPYMSAYVRIPDDCSMSCRFAVGDDIEVLMGSQRNGFEFVIQREGLARLVLLGQQALARPATDDTRLELPVAVTGRDFAVSGSPAES
jgi:hypothetical protein